jgi:Domain of unknown function (DUF1707)
MAGTIWERFEHDPRRVENAQLRAADRDRDLVQEMLGNAFAEGRLTREELDERSDQVAAARTLGELPPLVRDLVASSPPSLLAMSSTERHAAAELRYRRMRQQALGAFLTPTLICWAVWAATMLGGFPWPVFVMLGTGVRWIRLVTSHEDTVTSIEQSMEKRDRRRLEQRARRDRKELGRGQFLSPPE